VNAAALRSVLMGTALAALAGCGFLAYPAPQGAVDVGTQSGPPAAPPSPPIAAQAQAQARPQASQSAPPPPETPAPPTCRTQTAAPGTEIVQRGETLYQVSRCNNVPLRALIETNHLEPPYVLRAGQELVIPHPQLHVVAAGETLYAIARQNGVDVSALVRENSLMPPYKVLTGQTLIMPGQVATAAAAPSVTVSPREIQHVEALPPTPEPAPVKMAPPAPVPTAPPEAKMANLPTPVPRPPEPAPFAATPVPSPPPTAKTVAAAPAKEASAEEAPASSAPIVVAPSSVAGSRFIWPVKGKILSDFGAKEGGLFNDGINIAAARGANVLASDSGVVVYAGNEIRGFGNLVLIKHANGWMTAYGHNDQLLVHRGQMVQRGQIIAKAGSTGNVATPQLHFEIRRGPRAVDPTKYLAQIAS
jgi:murein DD-endopeptidase MepM/ murein hydrolase activator NlpD